MGARIAVLLYILPGIALTLSLVLFLLYVPAVSILTLIAVLLAISLTFALGVFAGAHRLRLTRWLRRVNHAS